MARDKKLSKNDIAQARLDPGSVFETPEDLLENPFLSRSDKIDLLKRWKYDAQEVSNATAEGMIGENNNDLLHRVCLALGYLEEGSPGR